MAEDAESKIAVRFVNETDCIQEDFDWNSICKTNLNRMDFTGFFQSNFPVIPGNTKVVAKKKKSVLAKKRKYKRKAS